MDRRGVCVVALLVLGLGVAAPAVQAGGKQAKVEFSYQMAPGQPAKSLETSDVYLRAGAEHSVQLFVKNKEDNKFADALTDVVVSLVSVDDEGKAKQTWTTAKLDKADLDAAGNLAAGKSARLVFAADKVLAELGKGPLPKLQLWLDAKGKMTVRQDLKVKLWQPERYVKVTKAHYDQTSRRVSFTVELTEEFVGPPCVVRMVLDPDYLPGLKPPKNKTMEQPLTKIGQPLDLFADLEFEGSTVGLSDARVFLHVDGFQRAFEFAPDLNELSGDMPPAVDYSRDVAVRFRPRPYVFPDKKNPLLVRLEIDARTIDQPARVELGFNRSDADKDVKNFAKRFTTIPPEGLPGLRSIKLAIDAGKKGDLVCMLTATDWEVPVTTADLLGRRFLRLRVVDTDGTKLKVSGQALKPLEAQRPGLAPLSVDKDEVLAAVTIDDSAAEVVRFSGVSEDWRPGAKVEVKVETAPRDKARYAPIEKAIFYFGKPSAGKIEAKEQFEGKELEPDVWSAIVRTPDKDGRYELAVTFQTGTGMRSAASELVSVKTAAPGEFVTTLKGKVLDSAERPKAGAKVLLMDAKGKPKGLQEAGAKGEFVFEKVPPGDYFLEASTAIPRNKGIVAVKVPPGKELVEKDVVVKMK
ncbi:MAG: carboxypeptidase-like regulatory domain-containing protein [Gemmataceae bacterium]|nr:carboxypeptidase-like regulatory domain-containing protein [Gemmataceae bacterium]